MHVLFATITAVVVKAIIETAKEELPGIIDHVKMVMASYAQSSESDTPAS